MLKYKIKFDGEKERPISEANLFALLGTLYPREDPAGKMFDIKFGHPLKISATISAGLEEEN